MASLDDGYEENKLVTSSKINKHELPSSKNLEVWEKISNGKNLKGRPIAPKNITLHEDELITESKSLNSIKIPDNNSNDRRKKEINANDIFKISNEITQDDFDNIIEDIICVIKKASENGSLAVAVSIDSENRHTLKLISKYLKQRGFKTNIDGKYLKISWDKKQIKNILLLILSIFLFALIVTTGFWFGYNYNKLTNKKQQVEYSSK